jgi:NADP-dependent 3-hydroxy acid dehydrogenase YdfG
MLQVTRPLSGQVAVVSGASSGIGRAIALALAAEGVSLCLLGRRLPVLDLVAEEAQRAGVSAQSYRVDLTSDDDVRSLIDRICSDCSRIDLLIHSAGVVSVGSLRSAPIEDLDWQYRTNVRAPYVLTQALLPMLTPGKGQIVFVNSSAGLAAAATVGQYAATKHALKAIADSLRAEVNADGIRVLSVYPGRTASPMQESVHRMQGRTYHPERLMQPADVAAVVVRSLALPFSAEVTDVQIRPMTKPT